MDRLARLPFYNKYYQQWKQSIWDSQEQLLKHYGYQSTSVKLDYQHQTLLLYMQTTTDQSLIA